MNAQLSLKALLVEAPPKCNGKKRGCLGYVDEIETKQCSVCKRRDREWNINLSRVVNALIPPVCFFDGCNCRNTKNKINLILHEKSGNGHNQDSRDIIYKEPSRASEFVSLYLRHHLMVHTLMDMGLTWDEIEGLKY